MFVVVDVKGGTGYFEVPEINKYSYVAVVSIEKNLGTERAESRIDQIADKVENRIAEDNIIDDDDIIETGEEE